MYVHRNNFKARNKMTKALLLPSVIVVAITVVTSQGCFPDIINNTNLDLATYDLIEGSIQFGLTLLRHLNNEEKSNKNSKGLVFSSHSIWSALVIIYMGARGATEQEMRNVLGIKNTDKVATWKAFRNIHNINPYPLSEESGCNIANRIYFQEGMIFKDCIRELLHKDIAFVDFQDNPENTREVINSWVENKTQQRIKDLIPSSNINSLTNMVIANAVSFNGAWLYRLKIKEKPQRFTTSSGKATYVTMMATNKDFLYARSEVLQCAALAMPYSENSINMIILLPENPYDGIDILIRELTPKRLRNLLDDMTYIDVRVMIPKFKFESSYELTPVLIKMGLPTLFNRRRVDLSDFTGRREFTVNAVHHKTFIEVNENGTDAYGSTRVISSRSARYFAADSSFMYVIRDETSGAILFLGTVRKPSAFREEINSTIQLLQNFTISA